MDNGTYRPIDRLKDEMKMVFTWKKFKTVTVEASEHRPKAGQQTLEGRRENMMKVWTMKRAVALTGPYLSLVAAAAMLAGMGSNAGAQSTPKYVVSSHFQLQSEVPISPAPTTPPFNTVSTTFTNTNGVGPTMGVNSHGDLFAQIQNYNTSVTVTYRFPADGSVGQPFFTTPVGYGGAGVAVDLNDNVYLASESGYGGIDSGMYEAPNTNGSYPSPFIYVYGSSVPPACQAAAAATSTAAAHGASTGFCALGGQNYVGPAYYYWQPYEIAVDYSGATYMSSNYDNTQGSSRTGIFYCDELCNVQTVGASAEVLIPYDPNANTPAKGGRYSINAMVGNPIDPAKGGAPGDLYWVDGKNGSPTHGTSVFYVIGSAAQGNAGTSNISTLESDYTNPTGISFDRAGNLYVTDASTGVWETPLVNGQLDVAHKFLVLPTTGISGSAVADSLGGIYYAANNDDMEKAQLFGGTFTVPPVAATNTNPQPQTSFAIPVGTASAPKTFTITFDSAVTLGAITAVQGGTTATEFTVSPGTCTAGTAFAIGSSCTFTSVFTPSGVGVRTGSIVIADSTGATTVTYLKGIGSGAAVTVDPGTPNLLGSTGLQMPEGVSVDTTGDTFVADPTANAVYEYPAGGGDPVSIGANLSVPMGVATDAAGNVFILNQGTAGTANGTVVEVPNIAGTLTTASQTTVLTGLNMPSDIVIDAHGNFYITNTGANEVLQYPSISRYGTLSAGVSMGLGLSGPTGLALDSSNNVYVADTGNNRVLELGDGYQSIVGAGLSGPTGVTVDASGAVLIADQGTGRLLRVPLEAVPTGASFNSLNSNDQVLMDSPLLYPTSMRLDGSGNLYVSDNVDQELYQLQRTSGLIDFLQWNLNTVSGPSTIVISSAGTEPKGDIPIGTPLYAPVPASTGFTVGNSASAVAASPTSGLGTLCPTGAGAVLPAGSSCLLSAVFSPTVAGASNYPLVFAAPGTNTATPTVLLSGTGVNLDAATSTIGIDAGSPQPLTYNVPFTIDFTITPSGQTPQPTGNVVFAFDGQNQRPVTMPTGGAVGAPNVASFQFQHVNAGLHTVQAHYEGDVNYASVESPLLNLTIDQATVQNVLTIVATSANPLSAAPTASVNMTAVLTPSIAGLFQGTVTFYAGTTVLGTSTVGQDPKTLIYSASYSVTTLPLGFYTISAVYSGNANYAPSTSNSLSLVISNPTFTVVPSNTTGTATVTSPAVYNMVVTSYSDFQGGVDFQCLGLPANAYCIFRPGVATLANLPYINPVTVPSVPVALRIEVSQNPQTVQGSQLSSFGWVGAALATLLLFFARRKRSMRGLVVTSLLVLLSFGGVAALSGCTASTFTAPQYNTPAGTYLVTVVAVASPNAATLPTTNVTTTFQLAVTVK